MLVERKVTLKETARIKDTVQEEEDMIHIHLQVIHLMIQEEDEEMIDQEEEEDIVQVIVIVREVIRVQLQNQNHFLEV